MRNVHQVDHVPNGPTNSAAITTVFPLRLCGGKSLVVVTRERRYGPSRLRVNDDDDDDSASGLQYPLITVGVLSSIDTLRASMRSFATRVARSVVCLAACPVHE